MNKEEHTETNVTGYLYTGSEDLPEWDYEVPRKVPEESDEYHWMEDYPPITADIDHEQ